MAGLAVYFIGIGGIGMSALARYFKSRGATVSGYDKTLRHLHVNWKLKVLTFILKKI